MKTFVARCAMDREVMVEGIKDAATYGNVEMLEILMEHAGDDDIPANKMDDFMMSAISSDIPAACELILVMFAKYNQIVG